MIKKLHKKLMEREISSVELTEKYLATIEKKDKDIFAYLTLTKDIALEQAKKVDKKIEKGEEVALLAGIPCALKDNILLEGVRVTAGSKILDNYIAPYDATIVSKLKKNDVVILGKTNLDEFAMGSSTENSGYGPTKNPYDQNRVPGGSSGGSAAAVAAEEAVWAIGSDTGGSIRQPASFCGLVGLKPTYGRVSRYGLIAMASSFDQIGSLTQSVEDAGIVLSAISGKDKKDATTVDFFDKKFEENLEEKKKNLKIGIVKEYEKNLSPEMGKKMTEVAKFFEKEGVEILEIELPNVEYSLAVYYIIQPSEASSNLARFDGIKYGLRVNDEADSSFSESGIPKTLLETYLDARRYGLGREVKRRIMLGTYTLSAGYYDAYYIQAQKVRTLIKTDFENAFEKVDAILTPTTPTPAFKFGEKSQNPLEMYLADIFTITANIVGVPAVSVPAGKIKIDNKEMPVGIQFLGKWFDEENLLKIAHIWEKNKN